MVRLKLVAFSLVLVIFLVLATRPLNTRDFVVEHERKVLEQDCVTCWGSRNLIEVSNLLEQVNISSLQYIKTLNYSKYQWRIVKGQ